MNVEVVVPAHNEEHVLEASIRRLHSHLTREFPFSARITVADSASTDSTLEIAQRLAAEPPGMRVIHLDEKGRGRALRAARSSRRPALPGYLDLGLSQALHSRIASCR